MSRTPRPFPRVPTLRTLRRHGLAAACSLALLGASVAATAQTAGSGTTATPAGSTTNAPMAQASAASARTLDRADSAFVDNAAMGGMAEVQMGRMAQERGTHQQVKDFGARMVQDHGKANTELQQLASAKGLQMPADAGRAHKKAAEKFSKMSGARFDREYMEHMVKDHKKDVADFEKAGKSATDPDIKAFAAKTLPTLQEHLRLAQATYGAVKNGR